MAETNRTWWRRFVPRAASRVRFWAVILPIHFVAFGVLFWGTFRLVERAYVHAGIAAARAQLDQAIREMPFLVQGANPHVFSHLLAAHQPIGLRLYRPDGSPVGPRSISPDSRELARVREFLAGGSDQERVWLEPEGGRKWVRGIVQLRSEVGCTPCHRPGVLLGAATMKLDFGDEMKEIRDEMRWRVAALLAAWIVLIGGVAIVVQRTVRSSLDRLDADLHATAAGAGGGPDGGVPLDPVAAEVHERLRRFLDDQRQRQAAVATRLERVDQLASLGQLAAGLAHEIKNPLAGIQGALEVFRDDAQGDAEKVRIYDEMLGELRRVDGILHRLLESGRPAPLRVARTDLGRLVSESTDLLGPSLRRRNVRLAAEIAEGLPQVEVDPAKIRQVVVNLVQNAAEAMPDGGNVTVRCSGLPGGAGVVLAVSDDGPGIPQADRKRLFEPFFTTKFAGTGLGLSISKSLVERHGGRIEVDSEPGRGTTFFVFLPETGAADAPAEGAIA